MSTLPHAPGEHGEPPVRAAGPGPGYYAFKAVKALASLQLTVGLLAVGIALVFFGTLAQIDFGIWTVVDKYFWSWTVDVPFELFRKFFNVFWKEQFPATSAPWGGTFPFPAGKLVGGLMLLNLLAAHAVRFKLTWKRAGVFLIHGGLILLFVGEFVTREFAIEQQMRITEGQSVDFAIDTRNVEVAFVDPSPADHDKVVTISQKRLRETPPGRRITHPELPVDVEVLKFMKNSDILSVAPLAPVEPMSGINLGLVPSEKGTAPAAFVRLYSKAEKQAIGVFAVSPLLKEQTFGPYRLAMSGEALTVVDGTHPQMDRVATVTLDRLQSAAAGERLSPRDFTIELDVVQYLPKAELVDLPALGRLRGNGAGSVAMVEAGEESGVATKQRGDAPAAFVRLYKKGTDEALGVYPLSALIPMLHDQALPLGDVEHKVTLRQAHYQKPYRVHLDDFRFDRYEGTDKPKNFSSDVKVYDAAGNLVRQQRIAMNEPLRYAGETFYQADWDKATEKTTVLQVVKNPGQIDFGLFHASIDYIACAVMSAGLLLHFGIFLVQFLLRTGRAQNKAAAELAAAPTVPGAHAAPSLSRIFPWVMLALMGLYLMSVLGRMAPPKTPFDYDALSKVPVLEGGRVKPLDTVARVNLRIISGREEFKDEAGKTQPAIRWYMDVIGAGGPENRQAAAWRHPVVRIDNEQVLTELGLQVRDGLRYSVAELAPKIDKIEEKYRAADRKVKGGGKLDTTEMKYKELHDRLSTIFDLATLGGPQQLPPQDGQSWYSARDFRTEAKSTATKKAIADAQARLAAAKRLDTLTLAEQDDLIRRTSQVDPEKTKLDAERRADLLTEAKKLVLTTPAEIERNVDMRLRDRKPTPFQRLTILQPALEAQLDLVTGLLPPEAKALVAEARAAAERDELAKRRANGTWDQIIGAYREKNATGFAAAVAEYTGTDAAAVSTGDRTRARVELMFNRFAPFYQCTGLYVIGFVLAIVGFVMTVAEKPHWAVALRRSSTLVLTLALVVHTVALLVRMYVMDRPLVFVTNLYSSAIFIGWGCVALCLVLERIFPLSIGNLVAASLGFATCVVAHNLATEDTLEMMQAVLDTNFWLATHVTTVTLGYTATFVAGFLASIYVMMMLGAVVRDSYQSQGEPSVGELLAFGTAAVGLAVVPAFLLWFVKSAMDKFEWLPAGLLDAGFWLATAGLVVYALLLILLRVSAAGLDEHGRPLQGQVPPLAQPAVSMALTPESGKILGQMIYGVLAFATLLSFVGTVLGGIWADQSWGRFWGWDPKENGAVLIVLWNALILHARWCGLVKDRGVAVLAVLGNAITAWSWFGTNQLGIGLHAYGFDSRLADGCFNFWLLQGAIAFFGGVIPRHFFAGATRRPAPATGAASADAAPPAPSLNVSTPVASAAPLPVTDAPRPAAPPANGHANGNGHPHGKGKKKNKRK